MKRRIGWMFALTAAMISQASAQQYVYPAKGQSPQQQKNDEAACYTWAVQQTGFDPAKPPPAIVGEAISGDAGTGAAVGAAAARGQSRRQNAAAGQQAQQQQQAATQQQQAAFGKARAACLEGKGYTVK
ncbi:MAG: hypothetical protein MUE59_17115 [Thiobacillaceae bacterium]|nr:hypothetical protein [Thiobacillaceae bacterium]